MHISKTRYVKFNNKSTQLVCYCCQTTPVVLQKRTTPVVLHNNLISNLLSKLVSLGKIRNSLLLQRMTKTRQSKQGGFCGFHTETCEPWPYYDTFYLLQCITFGASPLVHHLQPKLYFCICVIARQTLGNIVFEVLVRFPFQKYITSWVFLAFEL